MDVTPVRHTNGPSDVRTNVNRPLFYRTSKVKAAFGGIYYAPMKLTVKLFFLLHPNTVHTYVQSHW